MILLKSDWAYYPDAIADVNTTNRSFIHVARVYKEMGLENHAFILALTQPELQGVDPFDPTLSTQMRSKIALEARVNPWYYLREIVRIPIKGSAEPSPFIANRANIALMWCFLMHIDIMLIMPRQFGKSVGSDCNTQWVVQIAGTNQSVQLLTKDRELRSKNIERLKAMRSELPWYLNFFDPAIDADNKEEITCMHFKNTLSAAVSQKSPNDAEKVGRGLTSAILLNDEGPYCPNIQHAMPAALASATDARTKAKINGTFYGNIFTTTAGKKDSNEGKYMYDMKNKAMPWNERLLDADSPDHAIKIIRNHVGKNGRIMVDATFSHRQLGRTDAWLKDAIINAGGTKEAMERDFLNVWTSGGISNPLPVEILDIINTSHRDPNYTALSRDSYMFKWYIPRERIEQVMSEGHFVLGLDTSNAVGRDSNGLVLMDLRDMSIVGACEVKEASLHMYGLWLGDFLIQYPNVTLCAENKSSAQGIMDTIAAKLLGAGINPYTRMFNHIVDAKERFRVANEEVMANIRQPTEELYKRYHGRFGFMTTGNSRAMLYDEVLRGAARSTAHMIADSQLSEQLRGLIEKNGRIDHEDGKHDDLVIAWLLGHWFAGFARNKDVYGIPAGYSRSLVMEHGAVASPEDNKKLAEQARVRLVIEELRSQMNETRDEMVRRSIEIRIAREARKLDTEEAAGVVEQLLENARQSSGANRNVRQQIDNMKSNMRSRPMLGMR